MIYLPGGSSMVCPRPSSVLYSSSSPWSWTVFCRCSSSLVCTEVAWPGLETIGNWLDPPPLETKCMEEELPRLDRIELGPLVALIICKEIGHFENKSWLVRSWIGLGPSAVDIISISDEALDMVDTLVLDIICIGVDRVLEIIDTGIDSLLDVIICLGMIAFPKQIANKIFSKIALIYTSY